MAYATQPLVSRHIENVQLLLSMATGVTGEWERSANEHTPTDFFMPLIDLDKNKEMLFKKITCRPIHLFIFTILYNIYSFYSINSTILN